MDQTRETRRIPLVWLLAPVAVMTALGYLGDIIGPRLINDQPLLQIFLNPKNRWLLLASPQIDVVPFFLVGFTRLVLTDPLAFVLGRQYGDAAISWVEKQMGDSRGLVRKAEAIFGRVAPLVILIAPSFNWCVLAGANRMRVRVFVALNLVGTVARLALFRVAGDAFREEIQDVLEVVQRYQWWLVGVSFLVVAVMVMRSGGIETPEELAEEIEAELDEVDDVPEETAPREP